MPDAKGNFKGISVPRLPWMLEPTTKPEFEDMSDVSRASIESDRRISDRVQGKVARFSGYVPSQDSETVAGRGGAGQGHEASPDVEF